MWVVCVLLFAEDHQAFVSLTVPEIGVPWTDRRTDGWTDRKSYI